MNSRRISTVTELCGHTHSWGLGSGHHLPEVTLLLDIWARTQIWAHLTLMLILYYFWHFQLICLSSTVTGNLVTDVYSNELNAHQRISGALLLPQNISKANGRSSCQTQIGIIPLCVFLARAWLTIKTIMFVLNNQRILVTNVGKKYEEENLLGSELSMSLYCRFHYGLFWMKMDISEIISKPGLSY